MTEAQPDDGAPTTHASGQSNSSDRAISPTIQTVAWSHTSVVVGTLLLLATIGVALPIYGYTARAAGDRDPFIYAQTGKEILEGKRLYVETWIDKPPLGLLMYAAPQIVAPRSYQAIVVFAALIIVAQGALFARAFRDCLAASVACAIFVILYPLEQGTFVWPSTEHFANIFVTGNVLIARTIFRERSFSLGQCLAVGALATAAFHVRQNAVLCGLLPALAVLLSDQPIRRRLYGTVVMAVGALGAWAVVVGLVALLGDVPSYFVTLFGYPRAFAKTGNASEMIDLARYFVGAPLAKFTLVYALLAADARYRWLVVAAVLVGVGGCLLAMHNHPHYLASSLPYVALLIGLGTERLGRFGGWFPWLSTGAMAVSLVPAAINRMNIAAEYPNHVSLVRVAEAVDRLAPDGATLLVCGPLPSEAIQFASRLPAANRHCWTFQFQPPWKELLPKSWEEIRDEYLASPPGAIVIPGHNLQDALAEPPPAPMDEYLELVRLLVNRHKYRIAGTAEGYVILVRET